MISIVTGLEILGMVCGGVYIVGRLEANAKANKEAIESSVRVNQQAITQLAELFNRNMKDMKDLLQLNKEQQRDALNREISHIKDLISISNTEMREDIKMLREEQQKSNRIKERLAIAESSLKSLHHRLDIDPPVLMDINKEE